jgi:choline dehydrogenase
LAQWTTSTILLLEAGPDYRSSETPIEIRQANSLALQDSTRFAEYWWQPPARLNVMQEPSSYDRGRGIGGCSSVNCQVAIRGVPGDYDQWADEGCAGWGFDDVLRSFVRLEHDHDFPMTAFHGSSGPLPIQRPGRSSFGPIDNVLADSAIDLGYKWTDDHNSPTASGISPAAMNSRDGVRFSTSDAYLEPVRDKGNLTVLGNVVVDRILFSGRRATGLRCRVAGEWKTLDATEIILAGGAFNSPTILMRSGIGPTDQLRACGVDLVHENPAVGQNLSDHPALFLSVNLNEPTSKDTRDGYPVGCLARFDSNFTGAGSNDMGFGSFNFWGLPGEDCAGGSVFVTLFQSLSRGTISMTSSDPDADADINFNMLDDRRDMERMTVGVHHLLEVGTNAVKNGGAASVTIGDDVQSVQDLPQGDALRDWLFRQVGTIGHPCGTCRMGSTDDPRSVVDPDCRVIGVENLRVADASIIPIVPRANNHLSCVMVGEHLVAKMLQK